uniref:Uncharacterized protein n=1 Tax=Arundo donax TaxID=35708 RepID=A0A0A8Z0F0_ARUDO
MAKMNNVHDMLYKHDEYCILCLHIAENYWSYIDAHHFLFPISHFVSFPCLFHALPLLHLVIQLPTKRHTW